MAFKDLHEFVALLEKEGELIRIKTEVDAELEITEIADRVSKAYEMCIRDRVLVDKLEKDGLVERRLDSQDRRAIRVFITPAGELVADQLRQLA